MRRFLLFQNGAGFITSLYISKKIIITLII